MPFVALWVVGLWRLSWDGSFELIVDRVDRPPLEQPPETPYTATHLN